ncbi:uncharacterized protein LOC117341962 isoform X2 [Pecten maximus]|uniref:uncharacterized protein LOC117341962 isoform X2 n=1 Tax=Pecten maximus TaxID=6579 RepID=UPI00145877AA|nr:uncharacterized protein LOC117341962 isoform X2 [Pecten maximus]
MGTYFVFVCLLICAIVKQGLQQHGESLPLTTNSGGLSNSPVVGGSANPDMGLGGAVFRLGAAERNPNPDLQTSLGSIADFRMTNVRESSGNTAGGLSNQRPQNQNRAAYSNHVIQNDLKDTVIVHNFLDGSLQRMLMGSRSQPEKVVDQVNQLTEMINSPKTIKDAFPDQSLVDGNAVAVGSTGTAVGATFKDPTQQMHDLPSAFTPVKTSPPKDEFLIDFSNHVCKGQYRENLLNSQLYWVVARERIIARMQCPLGTLFSNSSCACTHVIQKSKADICKADLINTFDYGMDETSGNRLAYFASPDLTPTLSEGVLCFNGTQQLGYQRYNGYDFRYTLYIVLRFRTQERDRDELVPLVNQL